MIVTIYHVFTDNRDGYFKDLKEAKLKFQEYKNEFSMARLYEQTWQDDDLIDENCLESVGAWPR